MNQHNFPINSIVTCTYSSSDAEDIGKPSYQIIARVTKPTQWQVLQGGWNHSSTTKHEHSSLYGIPSPADKDYSNFKIYTDLTTFPNPELLI